MLINLISTANYCSFNVNLANIIGLQEAIYVSELININEKAINKNKITDEGYFTVDRKYICDRTTLTKNDQLKIDKILADLSIIHKVENKQNVMCLDLQILTSLLMNKNEAISKDISILIKNKKRTKQQIITDELKNNIITDNKELKSAYNDWIDSVMAKEGWMSKQAIIFAQQCIDKFSNRNLDVALEILSIASINGYRDISWAINKFIEKNKNYLVSTNTPTNLQVSNEVF